MMGPRVLTTSWAAPRSLAGGPQWPARGLAVVAEAAATSWRLAVGRVAGPPPSPPSARCWRLGQLSHSGYVQLGRLAVALRDARAGGA